MKIRILSFLLVLVMAFTVMSLSGCLKGDKAIVEASPKISQNVMANSDRPASGSVVKASGTETEEAVAVSTHTVATKDELDVAISNAADGDIIKLTADIESNAVIAINRAITLDLGGYKLTTTNGWGGLQLKNGCSVKNGTLLHTGRVNAIKAWDVVALEDLVIEVTDTTEGKTVGGISIQENAAGIDSIKNVTLKGVGLDYGIETYNCGNAQVIGTMENVNIDAVGTGMLISAPCGTATNCTIKGGVSGIDMLLKGTYSVSIDLVNCTVEGGEQAVYAHDEQEGYTYVGSIKLTADEDTDFVNANGVYLEEAIASTTVAEIDDVRNYKVTFISNVEELLAFAAAVNAGNTFKGETVKLTADIDFAGANWLEIDENGTVVTDFRIPNFAGVFDGQGHTIENFNYVVAKSGDYRAMMFSGTLTGVVKNLNVANVTATIAGGKTRVAAVANTINANSAEQARLDNVHVKNFTINCNNLTTDATWFGALSVYTNGGNLAIKDCSVTDFTLNANGVYMGSAVSSCITPNNDFVNVKVNNFVANIDTVNGVFGGFAGQTQSGGSNASFTDCTVTGIDFTVKNITGDNIGGFMSTIGAATQFYNCSTQGVINVTADTLTTKSVGGFIGDHGWNGMYGNDRQHKFENCVADVDITAVNANVGGFVGNSTIAGHPERHIPAYFTNCEAKGDVKTINGAAGGFVGMGDRGLFTDCSASGNVEGNIAGGFWGYIYPKTKAEAMGSTHSDPNSKSIVLDSCSATGTVTGTEHEAGLIGFVKDIYVGADNALGYATPIILSGNTPNDYNRFDYSVFEDAPSITVYVAQVGDTNYLTLADALEAAKGEENIVINLLADATLDITAWDTLAIGGDTTKTITINGNGHILTFNKKNSDWNHITTKNDAKLILNNMTLADSGYNNGPWNRYDHNFACDVELNNVVSSKALAFKAGATLNNVTVEDGNDVYAIWIQANGQTVDIDGLTVKAGRGIKIDEQYVTAAEVKLNVEDATFTTAKKAAILVKSAAGAEIALTNVDISGAADTANAVWNDADSAAYFNKIVVTGGSVAQEDVADFDAAIVDADNNVIGYYETLADAIAAAQVNDIIAIYAPIVVNAGETLTLNKVVTITYTSNVAGEDMITNRGTLVIDGATLVYNNTDTTGSNVTVSTISCEPGSVLEVKSGAVKNVTVKADGSSIYSFAIDLLTNGSLGDVTATISGGTVYSDYMAIRQFNNGEQCKNTLTVTGGEIYGAKRAIQVHLKNNAAYTTISGGKIEAGEGGYALCLYPTNATNIKVTGGEFIGEIYSGSNNFVSGGTFTDMYEAYLAEGYVLVEKENGTYGVKVWYDPNATTLSINNVAELVEFARLVNSGVTFEGKTVELAADINLSSVANWTPIGNNTNYFWGTFDGKNHTVSNITINVNDSTTYQYVGFFGGIRKATLENFTLKNVNIDVVGARAYVGAVVGIAHSNSEYHTTANLTLKNIAVDGCVINAESKSGSAYVGGLSGYCYPANMTGISVNNLTINPKASGTVFAGGLVGYMQGQNISNNGNTRAYYTVDGFSLKNITIESNSADVLIGGFAGYTYYGYITLKDSTIDGFNVDVDANVEALVGGLIGLAHRSDKGNTFTGVKITGIDFDITSDSGRDVYVGGMVGVSSSPITYSDCSVSGTITETTRNAASSAFVGGFAGEIANWGQRFENCSANVTIEASNVVGGFAGSVVVNSTYTDCTANSDPFFGSVNATLTNNGSYVASVGNVYYANFENAIAAIKDGVTVKLYADVEITKSVKIINNVTVDLNGHKLTGPDDGKANWYAFIVDGGNLTLKDSVGGGELYAKCYGVETKSGSFTMEGGKITATKNGTVGTAIVNYGGTVTIKGGELSGKLAAVYTAGYFSDAVTTINAGTLNGDVVIENYADKAFSETVTSASNAYTIDGDYVWADNGNGTYSLVNYIEWIKAELLAGHDVTLDRDIVVDGSYITSVPHAVNGNGKYPNYGIFTVVGDYDVTIDLNGYDVTYNGHATFQWNGKTVNSCTVAHGLFYANGGADLTIKDSVDTSDVTVYGLASGAYVSSNDTTLTIQGGTWKNIGCAECGGTNIFLYPLQGGELYIEGGYFEQALDAEGESYLIVEHGGDYANSVIDYSKTKVVISGGTFVGMNPAEIKKFNQTADNKLDTTTEPTTNGCEEGFVPVVNADGTFGVEEWYDATATTLYINNIYDLIEFARTGKSGVNYTGQTIELAADIDFGWGEWYPFNFYGTFNGNNKTISNLTYVPNADGRMGFFQSIGGPAKDLTLDGIKGTVPANGRFGGFARYLNAAVENIHVKNITVTTTDTLAWVGGFTTYTAGGSTNNCSVENLVVDATAGADLIAGFISLTSNRQLYQNCSVNGFKVTVTDTDSSGCGVGGFVAQTQTGWNNPKFANDTVTGIDVVASGLVDVGGFVAWPGAHTTAENCHTEGKIDVTGVTSSSCFAGGFFGNLGWNCDLGSMGHFVTDCSANVDIITKVSAAGGFVGSATNSNNNSMYATFTNCVANGDVTCVEGGTANIGGFAGDADRGVYTNCSATGTVTNNGTGYAGGFIGYIKDTTPKYDGRYPAGTRDYLVDVSTFDSCSGSMDPFFGGVDANKPASELVNKASYVAVVGGVYYTSLANAIEAAQAGDTVTIFAGTYNENLNVNKSITVVGEGVVNFNGKLNITADGATVKNLNFDNGSSSAGYINAKDVLVENCTVVGGNGFRNCYTKGTVTFKDSTITGDVYGIHFDGSAGGEIVIDNCVITGWTSFAGSLNKVTIKNSEFAKGNYNQLRFYQNAELTNVKFNPDMNIDFGKDGVSADFNGCTVTDGSSLAGVIYLPDLYEMGIKVTIDKQAAAAVYDGEIYFSFADALAAVQAGDVVIELLADATLDITAWDTLAIGGDNTETITINGNGHTLTFNKLNSDWNHITTKNDAKLILNDMTLADSGYNNGPWNRYDHNFACDVELNNVVSSKALAFKADATLNDVTVKDSNDVYAIWIQANGQTVNIDGLTVEAGRGIKIDEQYVTAAEVKLNVEDATFTTAKKAAILVKSAAGAEIALTDVDISSVADDAVNAVWNDADSAAYFNKIVVTGGSVAQEDVADFGAAIVDANNKVVGYYKTFAAAYEAAKAGDNKTIVLYATVVITADTTLDGVEITAVEGVMPAFRVTNGATLTITNTNITANDGYCMILGASDGSSAGNAIIKSGKFVGSTSVVSVTKGTLTVNGGEFEVTGSYGATYLLNCIDDNYKNGTAKIVVNGGAFKGFNPHSNAAEGAGTRFTAAGYIAAEDNGKYTVNKWNGETISNKDELIAFAELANSGVNFSGKTVELAADIDLGGMTWTPVKSFAGTFDGGNFAISNFVLDGTNGQAGFFKSLGQYPATVKNLTLSNVTGIAGSERFAILAATGHTSIVTNVHIKDVKVTTVHKDAKVGAIYGYFNWTSASNCTIENFEVDATAGAMFIGGFAAWMDQDLTMDNVDINGFKVVVSDTDNDCAVGGFTAQTQTGHRQPTFVNCDVKGLDITATGTVDVGGFIADPGAHTITNNCTTEGKIDATGITNGSAGGFFADYGWNNNESNKGGHKLTNCTANVNITTKTAPAGGFVGSATNDNNRNMPATLTDCKALGTVTLVEGGTAYIGGFAGVADRGTYTDCSAAMDPFFGNVVSATNIKNTNSYVASVGNVYYASIANAIAAAEAGDTVTIFAGTYNESLNVNKSITVVGEGDVNFNGKLNITADGATVKNLKFNNGSSSAGYINAKDVLVEGCTVVGGNGFRNCYTKGTVTFKDSTITGATYGIHFDGSAGGNIVIDKCVITGWTSFASTIEKVTVSDTTFAEGNYNFLRFYQDEVVIDGCTFNNNMTIDLAVTGATVTVTDSEMSDGSSVLGAFNKNDLCGQNDVTIDGEPIVYVAKIGNTYYETLEEALDAAAATDYVTIKLVADATLDYNAREAYGRDTTTDIIIDGQGFTLTLNQKDSDWSSIGMKNSDGKLTLKNMTIEKTGYGDTSGAWNTHAIIFTSNVEMTDVTVNNGIAVQNGATLNNVIINEANGYYGLWINGNGQTVTVNGGEINATNGGRGIKIADQYVGAPATVTLTVDGMKFNTAKKAAVLVSSVAGADITASNVDITNVAEDSVNFVWVDEDWAAHYGKVTVTGGTKAQENIDAFAASVTSGGAVVSYYKTIDDAIAAAQAGDTVTIFAGDYTQDLNINKDITVVGEGTVNFNGKLNITADGATVKNLNFDNGSGNGGYINAKDVLVEGCTVVGGNGFRNCYTKGTVTFKDSTITGATYGIHFDGSAGGEIVIDNCVITGWTSFAKAIEKVSISDTTFAEGNYNYLRFYQDEVVIDGCTFNNNMTIDLAVTGATVTVTDSEMSDGSSVLGAFNKNDLCGQNDVTIDGKSIVYVAAIGSTYYETLEEALADVADWTTIKLVADATLDYNAREAYGRDTTTDIIIDGQGFTLTLNQKDSDWSSIGMKNANGKLTLKNMTIEKTGYGDTSGAWNTHAINFTCNVEMSNVIVNNSMSVENGATLKNVTINEANGYYGLWIDGNGQTVTVTGGVINATNGGRGIKIADQYVGTPASVILNITGTEFNTAKKAAVLVSSVAGATITASGYDIADVAEDNVNLVWVDEDWGAYYGKVTVNGGTKAQEAASDFVVSVTSDGAVVSYYKTITAAIEAAKDYDVITILKSTDEAVYVPHLNKDITITANTGVVLTGGIHIGYDDNKADNGCIAVDNITFEGKGLTLVELYSVSVNACTFKNIDGKGAILVIGDKCTAVTVIENNVIDGSTGAGIRVRNGKCVGISLNDVKNVADNCITLEGTTTGYVFIENNTLANWAMGEKNEGRAIRVNCGNTANVTVKGNVMTTTEDIPEEFVKITGTTAIDLNENYWNGNNPAAYNVPAFFLADGVNIVNYYADAEKINLVTIGYVAEIDGKKYVSLADAVAAAEAGDTILLLTTAVVDEDLVLENLTITTVEGVMPAIRVVNNATLTITNTNITANDGYCMILGASDGSSAGNVVINSGSFIGSITVASVTKGTLTINGGEFRVNAYEDGQNFNFMINCIDANYASGDAKIEIMGGTFYNFNPADNAAEGVHTSFVADGYHSISNGNGSFTVSAHVVVVDAAVAPTCSATGLTEGSHCSVCNVVLVAQTEIAIIDHANLITNTVDATCVSIGYTIVTCGDCNEIISITKIEAKGHNFVDGVCTVCGEVGEAVAMIDGVKYASLEKAYEAAKNGDVIELLANIKLDDRITIEKTITIDLNGKKISATSTVFTVGTKGALTLVNGTIDGFNQSNGTILNAGGTLILNDGMSVNTQLNLKNISILHRGGTLIVNGGTYLNRVEINGVATIYDGTFNSEIKVTDLGNLTIYGGFFAQDVAEWCADGYHSVDPDADGMYVVEKHNYVHDSHVDPSCTTAGYTTYKCVCGLSYTDDYIPATGHTNVVAIPGKAPTCTETGLTTGSKCEVCGEVLVAQTVVGALGHTVIVDAAVAPTCTTTGLTEGSHCAVCGEILVAQTVIAAKGHNLNVVVTQPTCTEKGTIISVCSVCGIEILHDEAPATGHTEETYSVPGYTDGVKCSVCGEILVAPVEIPVEEKNVQVGDKFYASLADAVNNAVDGDVIEVLKSHTIDGSKVVKDNSHGYDALMLIEGKKITINFNGCTVKVTPNATIDNGGLANCIEAVIFVGMGSELILSDEPVDKTLVGNGGITVYEGDTKLYSIVYNSASKVTIVAGNYKVEALPESGSLIYADADNETIIEGGNFRLGNVGDYDSTKPWIFNVEGKNSGNFIVITGGTYNQNPLMNYGTQKDCEVFIPDEYHVVERISGVYIVEKFDPIAQIYDAEGNLVKSYCSLADALPAVENGQTLVLVGNDEYRGIVEITKDITLDLNGCTLTADGLSVLATGASIVDNATTKGLLAVPKGYLLMHEGAYPMLPVWNEEGTGYIFASIRIADRFVVDEAASSENKVVIDFKPALYNVSTKPIFKDGSLDNGIIFKYNVHCYDANGNIVETLSFTVSQDVIAKAYTEGTSIRYGIGGLSDAYSSYAFELVLESDTGLTFSQELGRFSNGSFKDMNGKDYNLVKTEVTE